MDKTRTEILAIQETHIDQDIEERRTKYQWFFSGKNKTTKSQIFEAGVGFVINTTFMKYVQDIEPISDRVCKVTLNHTRQTTLICCYIPQA